MELQLENSLQTQIADLMWAAETKDQVDAIITVFGHDAQVVYEMMLAASLDTVTSTDLAGKVLSRF